MTTTVTKKPSFLKARQAIKVLRSGKSFHGGKLVWKLPKLKDVMDRVGLKLDDPSAWIPGDWMPKIQHVVACGSGYHLTYNPAAWWQPTKRCVAYIAEYRGRPKMPSQSGREHKMAVPEVRLIRELTNAELTTFGIIHSDFLSTENLEKLVKLHGLRAVHFGGTARYTGLNIPGVNIGVYGSATCNLTGSGSVAVYEQAKVNAFSGVHVAQRGGRVRLEGSASARVDAGIVTLGARQSFARIVSSNARAQIRAGTVSVDSGGSVVITGEATVMLYEGSVDDQGGSSTITIKGGPRNPRTINMGKQTIVIDRTYSAPGAPEVYTSAKPYPHTIPPKAPKATKVPASAVPPAKTKPAAKKRK